MDLNLGSGPPRQKPNYALAHNLGTGQSFRTKSTKLILIPLEKSRFLLWVAPKGSYSCQTHTWCVDAGKGGKNPKR